ncbi:MAG: hypothetical protein K2F63_01775 [Muribaculaceae bacterium]|nr:hypothetical protein [Muribaculaceae bacterium]MDE6135475.1 hypothetical protein [Muribaculaceae bacterium]
MTTPHIPTPEERRQERLEERSGKRPNAIIGTIFGIIMIIVYVGMGVLLLINYFGWDGDWAWTRYVVGIVLIVYGIFRAYREYMGIGRY